MLVADLIDTVRQLTDNENTQFVTDTEILKYLNTANTDLYNTVVKQEEDYFIIYENISINAEYINLPATCYKLCGIDIYHDGDTISLKKIKMADRNRYKNYSNRIAITDYKYIIQGNKLRILPAPTTSYSGVIYYIPYPVDLTIDGTFDLPLSMWEEYLTHYAAVKILDKDEQSSTNFRNDLKDIKQQVLEQVMNRDQNEAIQITDYYRSERSWW